MSVTFTSISKVGYIQTETERLSIMAGEGPGVYQNLGQGRLVVVVSMVYKWVGMERASVQLTDGEG